MSVARVAVIGIAWVAAVCAGATCFHAAEPPVGRAEVLELPPFDIAAPNAVMRWQSALAVMTPLSPLEEAVLDALPTTPPGDEVLTQFRALVRKRAAALIAFALRSGESAQVPPGYAPGRGLASPDEWRRLARLKDLQVRLTWWSGDRTKAVASAIDLLRVSSAAARQSTDLSAWVVWTGIAEQGFDCALWIARQIDAGEEELAALSRALDAAAGAWPEGACNALRGELAYGVRGAVEHLPETRDIAQMLDALASFGSPSTPAGAAERLGESERPLLELEATLVLYGEMAASFITTATESPVWQHGVFGAEAERHSDRLLAELGVFGELAMNREFAVYPEEKLDAVKEAITRVENPIGKLVVALAAPNLDALAFTGNRTEAHRRCVRALVEWRRRLNGGGNLPTTPAAWTELGVSPDDVEDPFTGQPLFFDTEKLRIWSVGLDGTNNRGTGDPQDDPDGSDFWWSLEAE